MNVVKTRAKCPKCGSRHLIISEVTEASCEWEQNNGIIDLDDGSKEFGAIVRVTGLCKKCGHIWQFRATQVYDLIEEA